MILFPGGGTGPRGCQGAWHLILLSFFRCDESGSFNLQSLRLAGNPGSFPRPNAGQLWPTALCRRVPATSALCFVNGTTFLCPVRQGMEGGSSFHRSEIFLMPCQRFHMGGDHICLEEEQEGKAWKELAPSPWRGQVLSSLAMDTLQGLQSL